MKALGLIETRGLLPAIECADVMLKTAQVELVGRTFVGSGLVTIAVTGDVGAVKAAVEAAVAAIKNIGHLSLVSQHVIPRPHDDIESIVVVKDAEDQGIPVAQQEELTVLLCSDSIIDINAPLPNEDIAERVQIIKESISSTLMPKNLHKEEVDAFVQEFGLEKGVNALKALSVVRLRNLAREYKELGVVGRAISKANKDLLTEKLRGYYAREHEG
ncbi:MAG: microcompartment protein [Firmicutes bacterium]|nr:microcompartment protein [Bacillota bacterium]